MSITIVVEHEVADYEAWRPGFDEHGTVRKQHGCTAERVYRGADDANAICVVMSYPTREDADGFMADPSLAEVMQRSGVVGAPTVTVAGAGEG